jgi:hypothetical protein
MSASILMAGDFWRTVVKVIRWQILIFLALRACY